MTHALLCSLLAAPASSPIPTFEMPLSPMLAIAVPTPKANDRWLAGNSVATVLIVSGVWTASVAPRPIRAATTCQADEAQPWAIAARLQVETPTMIERHTPSRSTSQPVNRKAKAAAIWVMKASWPKSASRSKSNRSN